ncbi:MAG: hypothetical protein JWR37_2943 [Mycobacterium sp.]|nr:hypothetical protein [Mycobacterium sp.]
MRTALRLAVLAVAAACGTIAAPAGLASAELSPIETIGQLQADGYTVNIDRIGSAPLEDCVVTSVRNPQTVTKLVRVENHRGRHDDGDGGNRREDNFDLVPVVVSKSISVSLDCSH